MIAIALALVLLQTPPADVAPASTLAVAVRPTDLDSKGHVGNARYLEYFQWGRWRWLEERGVSNESLEASGAVLVVVNVNVNYRAECRYGDALEVRTSAVQDGEKKVVFRQQVLRPDGSLAAEGTVIMVAIDPVIRKSRPVPDALADVLARRKG